MKQAFLLLFVAIPAFQVFAQITIERSDYTLTTDGATVNSWNMETSGAAIPAEGANVVWDYSGQALTGPSSYTKEPIASNPTFPAANLQEASTGLALNLVEQGVVFYERLDDEGYSVLGRIVEPLTLPAQSLTGSPNDTITFLGANNIYETPLYYIKFPLNYGDSWNSEINIKGDYLMTVTAFGLDHVPASSNYNYVETDSVAGFGTLILPHPDGQGTVSMEALLLKGTTIRTDSFFLAGQPAPQIMLDALGLQQGTVSTYSNYSFFTKGLNQSALSLRTEGGQVTRMVITDEIRDIVSSIGFTPEGLIDARVFPNPNAGTFHISFEKADARNWTISLYNTLGQLLKQEIIDAPYGPVTEEVSLPASTPAGLYQYVIRNADRKIRASGQVLLR
ncbi:MAG: T9SS type A sorting domain-containing protein [bacterium]|nr:T9SS type A sorting domain-containing protein [bacterium]